APAARGGARRAPRADPARNLEAPARPSRGRPRAGAQGGPAPRVRARAAPARRARRVAGAVPAAVGRAPRPARTAPRPHANERGLTHARHPRDDRRPPDAALRAPARAPGRRRLAGGDRAVGAGPLVSE